MNYWPPPARFCEPAAFAVDIEVTIALMADYQIRKATERGEFDDLPGSGEPLDLSDSYDPDWWFKSLLKREKLALLPLSVELRKRDAELDAKLDQLPNEEAVRQEIETFNQSVIRARYEPPEGPPLLTMPRDVETTVEAWAGRKAERIEKAQAREEEQHAQRNSRTPWFRRWFWRD
ncbi:DnaJ family domain-containing protein [Nesterenkonia ebinurensis]|uniref:DnaJ family domain-containing protein n=1 Tax=Nesterenkonia ebinurensis TaxID=2608252 RepID=UPI00123E1869|nr:DUF1992 domain-containing protein [Nesterenkonia ebinurensis]